MSDLLKINKTFTDKNLKESSRRTNADHVGGPGFNPQPVPTEKKDKEFLPLSAPATVKRKNPVQQEADFPTSGVSEQGKVLCFDKKNTLSAVSQYLITQH